MLKTLWLLLLLSGSFQLKTASIEALPPSPCCDNWNVTFAPISPPLLDQPAFLGGSATVSIILCLLFAVMNYKTHVERF